MERGKRARFAGVESKKRGQVESKKPGTMERRKYLAPRHKDTKGRPESANVYEYTAFIR